VEAVHHQAEWGTNPVAGAAPVCYQPLRPHRREAIMHVQLPRLETDRLLLRPFTHHDEAIHRLIYADPVVARRFCGTTRTLEEVREWLIHRAWQAAEDDLGFWAVVRTADDSLLGLVALQPYVPWWIVWEHDPQARHHRLEVELSYALGRAHWDHGYATEAGRALIGYAFDRLRLPRIAYGVDRANLGSVNLMRRLGFRLERNLHPDGAGAVVGILDNDRA
jgi:[ribosomal protein S5]-alanine N-acetyltransferase